MATNGPQQIFLRLLAARGKLSIVASISLLAHSVRPLYCNIRASNIMSHRPPCIRVIKTRLKTPKPIRWYLEYCKQHGLVSRLSLEAPTPQRWPACLQTVCLHASRGTVCEYYSNCYCCVMSDVPPVPHISSCAPTLCRVCVSPLTPATHSRVTSAAAATPPAATRFRPGWTSSRELAKSRRWMFFPAIMEHSNDCGLCPMLPVCRYYCVVSP